MKTRFLLTLTLFFFMTFTSSQSLARGLPFFNREKMFEWKISVLSATIATFIFYAVEDYRTTQRIETPLVLLIKWMTEKTS